VDFYRHPSEHTELHWGLEPDFNTQFSFSDKVDRFYAKHIETESLVIEFFALPE
jgi:hypothetical protein